MGASNRVSRTFLTTYGASFVKRVSEGTPGSKRRELRNGKEVFELSFNKIDGVITSIELDREKGEFGKQLKITMNDLGEEFVLATSATGNLAFIFYKRMEQIDFSKAVEFHVDTIDEKTVFWMRQNGAKVEANYDKETVPGWKAIETDNGTIWDKSDALNFFIPKVDEVIKKMGSAPHPIASEPVDSGTVSGSTGTNPPPF